MVVRLGGLRSYPTIVSLRGYPESFLLCLCRPIEDGLTSSLRVTKFAGPPLNNPFSVRLITAEPAVIT